MPHCHSPSAALPRRLRAILRGYAVRRPLGSRNGIALPTNSGHQASSTPGSAADRAFLLSPPLGGVSGACSIEADQALRDPLMSEDPWTVVGKPAGSGLQASLPLQPSRCEQETLEADPWSSYRRQSDDPWRLAASALPAKGIHTLLALDKDAEEFIPQTVNCHADMNANSEECYAEARSWRYISHLEALVSTQNDTIAILMRQVSAAPRGGDVAATREPLLDGFGADPGAQITDTVEEVRVLKTQLNHRIDALQIELKELAASLGGAVQASVDKRCLGINSMLQCADSALNERFEAVSTSINARLKLAVDSTLEAAGLQLKDTTAATLDKLAALLRTTEGRSRSEIADLRNQLLTFSPVQPSTPDAQSTGSVRTAFGGGDIARTDGGAKPLITSYTSRCQSREMSLEAFRKAAAITRNRLPHVSVFVPMLMLDRRPWIDNVSCAELAKRFRRPMPQDQSKIFHSLQDQAGIDTFGPQRIATLPIREA